ncbi:MAG: ABC transporter permease subunit [Planctomycetes bacterium]|nr:ABC transporter permease subunit [Planctomycetota bacterium]
MTPMPPPIRVLVYGLLLFGSAVFSAPFVWMVTTSVKVDRELFAPGLRLLPLAPRPRLTSPYLDDRLHVEAAAKTRLWWAHSPDPPPTPEVLAQLARLVRAHKPPIPADLDPAAAAHQLTLGLYHKLRRILPAALWQESPTALAAAAKERVTDAMLRDLLADVHRRFCIGQIRVRSQALQEEILAADQPFSRRLLNETPQTATLLDQTEKTIQYASVNYDFREGDRVVLSRAFTLGFDASELQRLQIYLKPDDTWHELWLSIVKGGRRYVAERPVPLANYDWTMVTWQEHGPDDLSTKIKTWVLLEPAEAGPHLVMDPRQLKLTLTLRRSSPARAWWNKLRLNYDRVLDHIPFWRYVGTSLFLVVANITLTLFSCSLVAYAFARLTWPGRDACFLLMLATLMVPGQVTMIPHFLIWKNLGAYNTLTPLWLGHAFGNAFFIFLLRQFLKGVPRDLEDAARIDGCGVLRVYWHIMLPLIKPCLATIAIFTFMGTWNDFMGPLIYTADQRLYPLALGLYAFAVQVGNNPALTMAASLLMTLPVIVIFFFAQRYFIQGVTLTGLRG